MLRKCAAHLRGQWLGALALFLVLTSGTAYALAGHNTVFSDDIANREVKTADLDTRSVITNRLAANAVKTGLVQDGTLTGADVADNSLGSDDVEGLTGGDVADGSLAGADVADGSLAGADVADGSLTGDDLGDGTVTGDDVAESTLGLVPSAALGGIGDWNAQNSCQPESANFVDCGFTRVNIPEATQVLVLATVRGIGDPGTSGGTGFCRLATNKGGSVPQSQAFMSNGDNTTVMAVLGPIPAGQEDFGVECNEYSGGIQYSFGNVVTLAVSPL